MEELKNPDKIEANLNFGMNAIKQQHCVIQPQIMPNLLEHCQKKDSDANHASVAIGSIMGTVDGKIIDISNCFPMTLKTVEKAEGEGDSKSEELVFDFEHLKKMLNFQRKINDSEQLLGVYISSTDLDYIGMTVIKYFMDLYANKRVRSPLEKPIILTFDPELNNNKLDIKVLSIQSFFLAECALFSELPYKFNLDSYDKTGLDVLFYGQDHYDTMAILDDKKDISQETIGDLLKQQKVLSNRNLMLKNFGKLIENLSDCELYIQNIIDGNQDADPEIGHMLNQALSQFTSQDMLLLEEMVHTNFKDAMMTNNLSKLQMAQIHLTEKINNIFSLSLNKYILHQNSKFSSKQDISQQQPANSGKKQGQKK